MFILVALPRIALVGCDLGDGNHVPPGYRVAIDMKAIHFNPQVYPDPDRCDLFRFAKLRGENPSDSKYSFTTVDSHVCTFILHTRMPFQNLPLSIYLSVLVR